MNGAARAAMPRLAVDPSSLLVLAGFLCMYLPLYWRAAHGLWLDEDQAQGALILVVAAWLFWQVRRPAFGGAAGAPSAWGGPLFALGLLAYAIGRAFDISILEFASQPAVAGGALLLVRGRRSLAAAWFPVVYLLFMVPLPGVLVDTLTGPLKQWISSIVVGLLYHAGYPIYRTGVVITVGQYQLLVADACSGLHSMFSLAALGTLFIWLRGRRSLTHHAIMLAAILPIAFIANVVRVIVLVLVTYHFGDEAGQGFLHGAAGIVLFVVAVLSLFALDVLLMRLPFERRRRSGAVTVA